MNPIIPMWALTGLPTTERLVSELEKFKQGGIDQIMLYPRYGYEYEYMGEEWRRICLDCITFARDNDMKIWLYDEVNWPSGSCAGKVARVDPTFRAKRIACENGRVVIQEADPDLCKFAVDILNPNAVDCFISLTHEKYALWFEPYFGTTISGIFTDEPSFSYFSEADKPAYYDGAFDDYRATYGREAEADFLGGDPTFYANWYHLLGIRFRKTYLGRLADWCEAHGIALTGHLMLDNYVGRSVQFAGDSLKALDRFHICGVDEIWNDPYTNHMDFTFSQIARARSHGKTHAMAELFAYGPASLPYIRMNQMIWYAAAYGVDHFFTAISHFDLRGNRGRRDFFHDLSPASPDFAAGAPMLSASAAEAARYAAKTPQALVSVRYPYSAALARCQNWGKECQAGKLLWALTEALVDKQVTFALLAEEDASATEICFSFDEQGITEESSGARFLTADEAVATCLSRITRPVELLEADGSLAKNLLLRTYTDGSFVVIERTTLAPPVSRSLLLHKGGREYPVTLPASGVMTDQTAQFCPTGEAVPPESMSIDYQKRAVLRPDFFCSAAYELTLDSPMFLIFSRRVDPVSSPIWLDGEPLDFAEADDYFPEAMRHLYQSGKPILLSAGAHTITCEGEDIPHLPLLLITGNFYGEGGRLIPRDSTSLGHEFYGEATVHLRVSLPQSQSPLYLSFADNRLVNSIGINGELLAARAFAPYVYELPTHLYGKSVTLSLSFYSSYAPLFGNLKDINKKVNLSKNQTLSYCVPDKLTLDGLRIGPGKIVSLSQE